MKKGAAASFLVILIPGGEENMKLTGRQLLKISALADKLGIKIDTKADVEDMGSDVIWQIIKKAHTAEQEVAEVLAIFLECKPEEALDIDIMEKWGTFAGSEKGKNMLSFFRSAVASKAHD
jgi:hypothetical protein